MLRHLTILITAALLSVAPQAAGAAHAVPIDDDTPPFTIRTNAVDGWTGEALKSAKAYLLSKATGDTIHSTIRFAYRGYGSDMILYADLSFDVPRKADTYLLKGYAEGYDTVYTTVAIDRIGARENLKEIPQLEFYRKATILATATVTATKVKFYMEGDTLVYNADAFNLPKGSMLDALLRQMPGVEMREGGEIFVNGKKVESLLLNGKDFFRGDRQLMLNNLGAYTVNQVKVYDKLSERSMLAGRDLGDSEYVMDVKLKKEYMNGYIGNMEAGAGSASRYMARLFGMWYTTRSRVTLLGSLNNLNDTKTPGQNSSWQASATPGDTRTKMAGVDYNIQGDGNKWEIGGSATVNHQRSFVRSDRYTTNFHPDRDTYGTAFSNELSHNFDIKTSHRLILRPDDKLYIASGYLNYTGSDRNADALSGTFNSASEQLTRRLLEQIFSGELSSFADDPVYTSLTRDLTDGHTLSAGGSLWSEHKIPHTPDLLELGVNGNYTQRRYGTFNLYDINFNAAGNRTTDYQYIRNAPDHNWDITVSTAYDYLYSDHGHLYISPAWTHSSATRDSYLYRLDRLGDIGIFGVLPDDYLTTLDNNQTYLSSQTDDKASVRLDFVHKIRYSDEKSIDIQIVPSLSYAWRRLDYRQGDIRQDVTKNSFYVNSSARIAFNRYRGDQMVFNYTRKTNLVELNRLVDVVDDRDPLNIFVASADLKNSVSNDFTLEWHKIRSSKRSWTNYLGLKYSFIENALVNSYMLDPATGVRTYRMCNVGGNWNGSITESFSKTFGARKQFTFHSSTSAAYGENAGLLAIAGSDFSKNTVRNLTLNENIIFDWSIGKQKVGLRGGIKWRDTHGTDSGFTNFSATDAYYGINGVFSLPYGFGLSTDLTLYNRSGYTDTRMNSAKAVWNCRLNYTVKGGRWTIMLDGFDLLHQLDNLTYNVNEQARTEVYTNVLPRYVLLHAQYRFVVQPKKK